MMTAPVVLPALDHALALVRRPWFAPAALFLVAFCVYIPSFDAAFIVLDYNHLDAIRSTGGTTFFLRIFDPSDGGRDIIGTGDLYRPIYYTIFWFEYQLFGLDPLPYYLFTASLHGTNAVLVWLLAMRLTRSQVASIAAALLWAVHPQYADAVAWVSSITDQLVVMFALASVLLYARALELSGGRRAIAVGASFAAALLSLGAKESGLAVPPILVAYHLLLGDPQTVRERRVPWSLLPFLLIPIVYLPLRAALVGNLAMQDDSTALGLGTLENVHVLTSIAASPLVISWVGHTPLPASVSLAGYALVAALLLVAVVGSHRERFLVWWYVVALGPFLTLPAGLLVGRYLYLPFVAVAILAGLGVAAAMDALGRRWPSPYATALPVGALAAVAVWFALFNADFQGHLNAKGDDAQAFLTDVEAAYPTLSEGTQLVMIEFPPPFAFHVRPAVRLLYDAEVDVVTEAQLYNALQDAETVEPDSLRVYPRGAPLSDRVCGLLDGSATEVCP